MAKLTGDRTCKKYLQVHSEGDRTIQRLLREAAHLRQARIMDSVAQDAGAVPDANLKLRETGGQGTTRARNSRTEHCRQDSAQGDLCPAWPLPDLSRRPADVAWTTVA